MKTHRTLFYFGLLAATALSVFVVWKHRQSEKYNETNSQIGAVMAANGSDLNSSTDRIQKDAKTQMNLGKIVSDTTTSSNRIVVAERDGVKRTAIIPPTLARSLTDEQILYGLFYTNPPPQPSNVRLNEHLTFYGLTLDDQTNILPGVTISGGVGVVDGKNPPSTVPIDTTSDANGRFQIDVDYGQHIWLSVSKGTNYISPPQQAFRYGETGYGSGEVIYNPNINNPVVFVLTKKKAPEPLVEHRRGFTAPNTGEPVRIDLITGQIVPTGGDLIVSITCPEPFQAGSPHVPWKLVLQATGGGFVTIRNEEADNTLKYQLEAPDSGYDDIVVDHPSTDPQWSTQYGSLLYLKSRNGQLYGKLSFGMNILWDERGVPFGFHSFVNTNESHNLQDNPPPNGAWNY